MEKAISAIAGSYDLYGARSDILQMSSLLQRNEAEYLSFNIDMLVAWKNVRCMCQTSVSAVMRS